MLHVHVHACITSQDTGPCEPSLKLFIPSIGELLVGSTYTDKRTSDYVHVFHFITTTRLTLLHSICIRCVVRCSTASPLRAIKCYRQGQCSDPNATRALTRGHPLPEAPIKPTEQSFVNHNQSILRLSLRRSTPPAATRQGTKLQPSAIGKRNARAALPVTWP
jgi:hypothetical protein